MKHSRNAERRQHHRERHQLTAAVTIPSSPLDLNHVSYDKCVASLQSRPGPIQADDNLDLEHTWTSVHMNNNVDAPITGHTLEQFRDTQRTNCKNSSMPRQELGRVHLLRVMHAPGARISRTRDARAQVPPRRAYHRRAPSGGVQASQSHFDQPLQHPDALKCSRDDTLHANNRSRRVQQPRHAHLSNPEMHAPSARMSGHTHLMPPTDARVQQGARANWGDTRLLLLKSSATWGSTPP